MHYNEDNCYLGKYSVAVLQIRRGNRDDLGIIILISPLKYTL